MEWLVENIGTLTVALILIAVVAYIVLSVLKDKKAGRHSCGCGCENCALRGKCCNSAPEKTARSAGAKAPEHSSRL